MVLVTDGQDVLNAGVGRTRARTPHGQAMVG